MKVIEQHAVALDPRTFEDGVYQLQLCEYAGRKCYNSVGKMTDTSYEKFLKSIIKNGHTSVLEHGKVSVDVITSRDVLAEITRHRTGIGFSVQSQRYVDADNSEEGISFIQPQFYIPKDVLYKDARDWCASRCWELGMEEAEERYRYLINQCHSKPEDARKVLPNSTATTFVMSMNFRELLHIVDLRTSPRAYPEMRVMMQCVLDALAKVMPPIWTWGKEEET